MSDDKKPDPNGPYGSSTGGQRAVARMIEGVVNTRKPRTAIGYAFLPPALAFNAFRGLLGVGPKRRDDK